MSKNEIYRRLQRLHLTPTEIGRNSIRKIFEKLSTIRSNRKLWSPTDQLTKHPYIQASFSMSPSSSTSTNKKVDGCQFIHLGIIFHGQNVTLTIEPRSTTKSDSRNIWEKLNKGIYEDILELILWMKEVWTYTSMEEGDIVLINMQSFKPTYVDDATHRFMWF